MKKIILTFSFFFCVFLIHAQDGNIVSVFLAMPDSVVYGISADARDLLIADVKDTTEVKASTDLYSNIVRLEASDTYLNLQTSDIGNVQIKLLPLINSSYIVCVVKTVCGGVCDSSVRFYTTDWLPLESSDFLNRKKIDWFIRSDVDTTSQDFRNAIVALDMIPMKIKLSPEINSMSIQYDIKGYLSKKDYETLKAFFINEPKVCDWSKTLFYK